MSDLVYININGVEAKTDGSSWESKDETIQLILNIIASKEEIEMYSPSYAYSMAQIAEEKLNAKIIKIEIEDTQNTDIIY